MKEAMIREAELFVMSEQTLMEVIGRIRRPEHWKPVLPPLFDVPGLDQPVTVRKAVQRYAVEEAWIPDMLAGRTMDEVGQDKFDGDLLGADPQGGIARLADAAGAAVSQVTDPDAPVYASYGEVTTSHYLWRLAITRSFVAHDIAFALGTTACPLTEEFARPAYEFTAPDAERWRALGIFREPLPLPPGHVSWRDQFLRLAGRDPHPGHEH